MKQHIQWRIVSFISVILLIYSCGNDASETVSFDEIAPVSDKYKNGFGANDTMSTKENERPAVSYFLTVADSILPQNTWTNWDTLLFPDRFGALSTEKWLVKNDQDSMTFMTFQFKDSLRTKNAFFNWLDCFGNPCKSFQVGGNVKVPKRNGLFLVGQKSIVLIEGNRPIKAETIRAIFENDPKKQQWIFQVEMPKKGKTTWNKVLKGELQIIQPIDENN